MGVHLLDYGQQAGRYFLHLQCFADTVCVKIYSQAVNELNRWVTLMCMSPAGATSFSTLFHLNEDCMEIVYWRIIFIDVPNYLVPFGGLVWMSGDPPGTTVSYWHRCCLSMSQIFPTGLAVNIYDDRYGVIPSRQVPLTKARIVSWNASACLDLTWDSITVVISVLIGLKTV